MRPAIVVFSLVLASAMVHAQQPDLYDVDTVRTLELTFHQSNWWQQLTNNYSSKTYIKADLKVGSVTYKDVGVRFRGNSSYKAIGSSQKKPFKISMDAFVPGQELYGYSTVNLNNGFRDPTFTREVISCEFYCRFMPCMRCNYLNLVINGQSWGPYINVQQFNKDLLEVWFRDEDGNRYRGERQAGSPGGNTGLIWLGSSQQPYTKAYELKNTTPVNPWTDLIHLCDVLNNTPAARLQAELPRVLDVDNTLRYLAGINVLPAIDSYIGNAPHNFYLYNDGYHGRFSLLPWDLNAAFGGNAWLTVQQKINLSPFYYATRTDRPLLTNLLARPPWRARYLAHLRTMVSGGYDWATLGARVAKHQALIGPALQNDLKKLYTMALFSTNVTQDVQLLINNRYQIIPGLKPFIEGRRAYLLNHPDLKLPAPVLSDLGHTPARPTSIDKVWITVRVSGVTTLGAVTLFHRHKGPFVETPMFDDGNHGDGKAGDGVYGAAVPPMPAFVRVEYFATAESGAMTVCPATGSLRPETYGVWVPAGSHPVMISEFVARNTSGIRDEKGEREDWIEILNTGATPFDLAGYHLTDDVTDPTRWTFPAGQVLMPGKSLIVWADNEAGDGPLHATFKLSGGGEEIALFDRDGKTPLDAVAFGPQHHDVSTGRVPGFPGVWVTFPAPTPWAENRPVPCGHLAYGGLRSSAAFDLAPLGTPRIASVVSYKVGKAPPSTPGLLALSPAPFEGEVGALGTLLLDPSGLVLLGILTDASGTATPHLSIPAAPALVGAVFYLQAFVYDGKAGGFSAGVMTRICP